MGSMQWYLITEPGTYTIAIDGNPDVDFLVYKSTDLSRPIQPDGYLGETRDLQITEPICRETSAGNNTTLGDCIPDRAVHWVSGRVQALIQFPIYVRVFGENRSVTGDYKLIVHKHRCESPRDFCVRLPNVDVDRSQGERFIVQPDPKGGPSRDERYFRLDTEAPDSGAAQRLSFFVTPHDGRRYCLEIMRDSGAIEHRLGCDTEMAKPIDSPPIDSPLTIDVHRADFNNSKLFMKVTAMDPDAFDVHYDVTWKTNLIVAHSNQLKAPSGDGANAISLQAKDDENDGPFGDDHNVRLHGEITGPRVSDGASDTPLVRLPSHTFEESFDSGHDKDVPWEVFRFTSDEQAHFWLNVTVRGDDFYLEGWLGRRELPESVDGGAAFPEEVARSPEPLRGSVLLTGYSGSGARDSGRYRLHYLVSHGLQDGRLLDDGLTSM
jgi:hypothetical protein